MLLGIDVGGTNIRALLIDPDTNQIVDREHTPSTDDGPKLVTAMATMVDTLRARSGHRIDAVGLGIAGLAHRDGTMHYSPNLIGLNGFSVGTELAARIGHDVAMLNDANASTWAEALVGAGKGCSDFIMVNLGTGIGAGLVSGGQLITGANGFAGEVGHMVIDMNGEAHHTGQRGPWEFFASGSAYQRLRQTKAGEAVRGDDGFEEFCRLVAVGAANLVQIFDPARIVVGGGMSRIGDALRNGIEEHLGSITLGAQYRPPVEVVLAELGDDAGAIGAALWAQHQLSV